MSLEQTGSNKRDKRRQTIALRINYITEQFQVDRDINYREMLHALQGTLSSLHSGNSPEFLETLADLEEERDQELMRLALWEKYRIERAETEYQNEVAEANEEYARLTMLVKERLMTKLEGQRKNLREDKALLDIANDHMVYLNSAYGASGDRSNLEDNVGSPNLMYANDRRHLRRRGDFGTTSALEDISGISSNEGRGNRTEGGSNKRRKVRSIQSDNDLLLQSDRETLEGILSSSNHAQGNGSNPRGPVHSTSRSSKSYQPPAPLKNDDVQTDLTQLRSAINSFKKKK